ncbi:MAG: CDP-alcohol phosphatidyltransferase family protein [Defluviitaleaceae bacterium]|nr:CDP-alcohol phosphatidyltransferase family protein [Defluviitaleaceae bacterium]
MKHIPNILSVARILLATSLLVLSIILTNFVLSPLFLLIYTIAGVTDMLDGPLARKFNAVTPLGANLDGAADYTFTAIALILVVPQLGLNMLSIAIIFGVVLLKLIGMVVGYIRYKQLMMMHTYAAKTGAMLAFSVPMILFVTGVNANLLVIFIGTYVYLFLLEEIVINMILPEPKRDITGLYEAIQIRRRMKLAGEYSK